MKLKIEFTLNDERVREIMEAGGISDPLALISFIRQEFTDVTGLDPDDKSTYDLKISTVTDA